MGCRVARDQSRCHIKVLGELNGWFYGRSLYRGCSDRRARVASSRCCGASNISPCLRRGVDRPRGIAGNGRAHLHRSLVTEAPVEAQGIRGDELHEALLSHAIVVIIWNYDVPELLLWWVLDRISALSLEREALGQLAPRLRRMWDV